MVETITGSGELMKEIDRRLRVSDTIIRHLTVRVDDDIKVAERLRASARRPRPAAAPRAACRRSRRRPNAAATATTMTRTMA